MSIFPRAGGTGQLTAAAATDFGITAPNPESRYNRPHFPVSGPDSADSRASRPCGFAEGVGVVELLNAFIGKTEQPSAQELSASLGPAVGLWNELVNSMAANFGVATQEWKGICVKKYGWSLQLKLKKRTFLHLAPRLGCFQVAFILGDKALAAANAAKLPKKILQALAEAPHYPEGTGLRLVVNKAADLAPIRKLAELAEAERFPQLSMPGRGETL